MNSTVVTRFIACFSALWTVHAIWYYFVVGPDSKFMRFDPKFSALVAIGATLLVLVAGQILRIRSVRIFWERLGLWRLSISLLGVGLLVGDSIVRARCSIWIPWMCEASFVMIGFPILHMTQTIRSGPGDRPTKMSKPGISRGAVLCYTVIVVAGIVALVFVAPIIAAIAFATLIAVSATMIGRTANGWRGFLAFAKEMVFGW